jgi:hypothetical protein
MNINLTLVVQLVHFLIAYWIIRALLVRPTVGAVSIEREEHAHLKNALEIGKRIVAEREREKVRRWEQCQALFAKSIPGIKQKGIFRFEPLEMKPLAIPSQKELNTYAHDIEQIIVQKVKHVR